MPNLHAADAAAYTVDVAIFRAEPRGLSVLLQPTDAGGRERQLPWAVGRPGEPLLELARRVAREAADAKPSWVHQVGAFADARRHPGGSALSVAYVAVIPPRGDEQDEEETGWVPATKLASLPQRQRQMVEAAIETVRNQVDLSPVAFRFLPPTFTLSQLQAVYELLLSRRLHKASFRRALQAASLVASTGEWRSEGRGRPAQLYKYAPRRKRVVPRGVRFELLAG